MSRNETSFSGWRRASASLGRRRRIAGQVEREDVLGAEVRGTAAATWLRTFASTDATSTTVTMPMTMPTMAERSGRARAERVDREPGRFADHRTHREAVEQPSLVPQRRDDVERHRPPGRIPAGGDAAQDRRGEAADRGRPR